MDNFKPTVTQGNTILRSDYNNIQTKISTIMGTGSGQSGYGQTLASSQVAADVVIDDAHWDNLRTDLLKARQHQTGADESAGLTDVAAGQLIDDAVITAYENFATTVVNNKFALGPGQFTESSTIRGTTASWNGTKTAFITYNFTSADQARYFFNSGGILRFYGLAGVNGGGSKDQTWWDMTSPVVRSIGAGQDISFYSLNNNYQRLASISAAAGVYVENRFYIEAQCNSADNSSGGATSITVRIIFEDNDTGDQTGTGAAVDESVSSASVSGLFFRATGTNVEVTGPTITAPNF